MTAPFIVASRVVAVVVFVVFVVDVVALVTLVIDNNPQPWLAAVVDLINIRLRL